MLEYLFIPSPKGKHNFYLNILADVREGYLTFTVTMIKLLHKTVLGKAEMPGQDVDLDNTWAVCALAIQEPELATDEVRNLLFVNAKVGIFFITSFYR